MDESNPLTDEQLQQLRRALDEREAVLREEVLAARQASEDAPSAQGPQVGDQADAGEERDRMVVSHAELQRDQEELQAIADARARMTDGRYGHCVACGRDIPFARLQVQPMAARCLECQTAWERTHESAPRYTA